MWAVQARGQISRLGCIPLVVALLLSGLTLASDLPRRCSRQVQLECSKTSYLKMYHDRMGLDTLHMQVNSQEVP